jgi:Fe-S cluster assembly protein SufD
MNDRIEIKDWYLSRFKAFENSLNGESVKPIHKLRKEAIENFSQLNFPTIHDEDWKYTNITPLLKYNFKPFDGEITLNEDQIKKFLFKNISKNRLVFVNGHFVKRLSKTINLPNGVIVGNIASEIKNDSNVIDKHFSKYANYKDHIFTALSTAFTRDGAFIFIPDGKIVEEPIHILFITDSKGEKILTQPRNLFVAGKNSQVSIIEHYTSINDDIYFTNVVSEIVAGQDSIIDHVKLQEESINSFHISREEIDQERGSNFTSHSISFGGAIARNDIQSHFNDQGSECTLNGLYLLKGKQLYDSHTMIDHAKPHCNSHEHYKGILDDQSRGVFNGKVLVRPDAQKTNAFQENNNIILSDDALVNTKPQLEIFADDVKCSHGATVGQLDMDSLFYLKSRGIGEEKARTILIHAFASDIVKTIKIESVKNYLEDILENTFNKESSRN